MAIGMGKSDKGTRRARNEDFFYENGKQIGPLPNLYIVADGMGGHKAGDTASRLAVETFVEYVSETDRYSEKLDTLISGVNKANTAVYEKSLSDEECSGMGSTFIACTVCDDFAYVAHVGDSRLYKLSGDSFNQLTSDHSFVAEMVKAGRLTPEQAEHHPQRSVITRAVGTDIRVVADGLVIPIKSGDTILMCTDGLTTMVDDKAIKGILADEHSTLVEKTDALIQLANINGGLDNITLIIINV